MTRLGTMDALIRVDLQNDFCETGSLAVSGADLEFLQRCNALAQQFRAAGAVVVDTQDYHPANHSSFAANHADAVPFSVVQMPYGPQTLWPVHCVQGSWGAEFPAGVDRTLAHMTVRKGMNPALDSYSAFLENDKLTKTGLAGYLSERGVRRVFVCGLAADYCVYWTAKDARLAGFTSAIVGDATRALDGAAWAQETGNLNAAGVQMYLTRQLQG